MTNNEKQLKIGDKVQVLGTYGYISNIDTRPNIVGEIRVTVDLLNGSRYGTSLSDLMEKQK